MAADWYCKIAGAQLGPLSTQQLKALAADGRLRPDDEVCQGEGGKWVQASRVKGLIKSDSSEVLVARPLEDRPSAEPKATGPRATSNSGAIPKAKSAAAPPEPPAAAVPVAKAATAAAPQPVAQAVAAQSPFNFAGPDTNRSGSSKGRATSLSPADAAKHRQKQRKKLLFGSIGALAGLAVIGAVLLFANPFGSTEDEGPSPEMLAAQQFKEAELGDELSMDVDDLVGDDDTAAEVDASGEKWLDASKQKATAGPVTVRILSVAVGKPRILRNTGSTATPKDDYLIVTLELANSDPKKKVGHSGWSRAPIAQRVVLNDNLGNPYQLETFSRSGTIEGQKTDTSLYADDPVLDILVFERPVDAAEHLRLELPASTFGEDKVLRFQIPRKMIGVKASEEVAVETSGSRKVESSSDDAGASGGEVYQLEAVERAIGGMEPAGAGPLVEGYDALKRDNPELFPDQQ